MQHGGSLPVDKASNKAPAIFLESVCLVWVCLSGQWHKHRGNEARRRGGLHQERRRRDLAVGGGP